MKRAILPVLIPIALGTIAVSDSSAIIIRDDRPDSRYIELGSAYRSVGSLLPVGEGVVTLIHPLWVITAAHVAEEMSPFTRSVRFGDSVFPIRAITFHPTWGLEDGGEAVDMALMRLDEPVEGFEPILLYDKKEELGQTVVFVGWGESGNGRDGPGDRDGLKRGARNTVSGVEEQWLTFLFDAPPGGDDLEGIPGPGDSGGPALLDQKKKVFILGVSSGNDDPGEGIPPGRYGNTEFYARVSPNVKWIRDTIKDDPGGRVLPPVVLLKDGGWPGTPAGMVAAAFFDAFGSGEEAALARFEETYRTAAALEEQPAATRVENWNRFRARSGTLTPDRYVSTGPGDISVLVRTGSGSHWLNFRFLLETTDPPKFDLIRITPGSDPAAGS